MPCIELHWTKRGHLCFGRSHHQSAVVSHSHNWAYSRTKQGICACNSFLNGISTLWCQGSRGEREDGCTHEERDMTWNVVGFTKHEYRNHQKASLNCGKKNKPLLSSPRPKCNTVDKGSQSVGMEHTGGVRQGVLYRLWLLSCSAKQRRSRSVHWSGDFVHTEIFLCLQQVKRSWDSQNPQMCL